MLFIEQNMPYMFQLCKAIIRGLHSEEGVAFLLLWLYSPLLDLGCFFSFLIIYTVGSTPWMRDQPVQGLYIYTDIRASSGIRTHNPRVRASEDNYALDSAVTLIGLVYFNF
jgi:hypothetical protein